MIKFDGKNALIIEDDKNSIRVLAQLLHQVNVQAIVIYDSQTITQVIDDADIPDVIFLDLEMTASNGYGILAHIQDTGRFKGVPVIAYTTHVSHLNDTKRAGFNGFLGKPVDGRKFPIYITKIFNGEEIWEIPG